MHPIDLHSHSTKSDGSYTPAELVRYAHSKGLSAIALTDHDTAEGIGEAMETAVLMQKEAETLRAADTSDNDAPVPEVIPGTELSTQYKDKDVHIVGLFIDWKDPSFNARLREFADARIYRNRKMCRLLTQGGYPITYEALEEAFPDTVITRAHFARLLMEKGYVRDRKEAFAGYLAYGGKYVPTKDELTPERVMQMFYDGRIWPSLAHPVQYHLDEDSLVQLIAELKAMGLRGIEAWHSSQSWQDTARLQTIARLSGLIPTGGSDFHGSSKPDVEIGTGRGNLKIQERVLDAIKEDYAQQF